MKKIISQIGEELLQIIKDEGDFVVEFLTTPYGKLRFNNVPRSTFYSNLYRMEKKGLIKRKRKDYKNIYNLTDFGRQVLKKPKKALKRTDGFSTVIIFDIQEEKAKQRTTFRRYLIRQGYTLLQKSVLISSNKITQDIKDLISELDIKSHISVLSGKIDYSL